MSPQKPPKKDTRPQGRPTKYREEYCDAIIEAGKKGLNITMFACEIGVHRDQIYEWAKRYPIFHDAFKQARQHCEVYMMKLGMAGMTGKYKSFGQAAWIFWMKAQFKWRDDGLDDIEEPITEVEFV